MSLEYIVSQGTSLTYKATPTLKNTKENDIYHIVAKKLFIKYAKPKLTTKYRHMDSLKGCYIKKQQLSVEHLLACMKPQF